MRSSCCCSGTTLGELLIYKDIEIMEDHVRSRILTIRKSIKGPLPEYILSPIRETYGLEQWAWNFIVHHNYLGSLWKIWSPEESQRFWIHKFTVRFRNMYFKKCQKGFQSSGQRATLQKHWCRVNFAVQPNWYLFPMNTVNLQEFSMSFRKQLNSLWTVRIN